MDKKIGFVWKKKGIATLKGEYVPVIGKELEFRAQEGRTCAPNVGADLKFGIQIISHQANLI